MTIEGPRRLQKVVMFSFFLACYGALVVRVRERDGFSRIPPVIVIVSVTIHLTSALCLC